MRSSEQKVREYNQHEKNARSKGTVYIGPTPLSALVCGGAEKVASDLSSLLDEEAWIDQKRRGPLCDFFEQAPPPIRDEFEDASKTLLVRSVLLVIAGCSARFMARVTGVPLLLLWLLEETSNCQSDRRKSIARMVLECMETQILRHCRKATVSVLRGTRSPRARAGSPQTICLLARPPCHDAHGYPGH